MINHTLLFHNFRQGNSLMSIGRQQLVAAVVVLIFCCCTSMYFAYSLSNRAWGLSTRRSAISKAKLLFAPTDYRAFATSKAKTPAPKRPVRKTSTIWSDVPSKDRAPLSFSDRITLVSDLQKAEKVLAVMYDNADKIWACDTEVADIDVKVQGPVGNGE